jgi:hypothetical protein
MTTYVLVQKLDKIKIGIFAGLSRFIGIVAKTKVTSILHLHPGKNKNGGLDKSHAQNTSRDGQRH